MDYRTELVRHADWPSFQETVPGRRVLLTTKGETTHSEVSYLSDDVLLFGQESAGVPRSIHDDADARVRISLSPKARSLNLSVSVAIALAEASRQLARFS